MYIYAIPTVKYLVRIILQNRKKKTRKIGQTAASESFSQRTEITGDILYTHPDFRKARFEP